MKEIRCADAGMACDWIGQAATTEELMKKVAQHAREKHGMKEIPSEMTEQVKKLVHDA